MDSLRKQYKESEKIRRGVHNILKSNNFTEEYKDKIKTYLNEPSDDSINTKENILAREVDNSNQIIISTWNGGSAGWVETPVYIDTEVEKAVDTVVTELIPKPPKQREKTVPEPVYLSALNTIDDITAQLVLTETELQDANSEIQSLKSEIELALQSMDAERLKTASANNEAEASDSRFRAVLSDFQNAIQKGIQESVERVSLEAQTRGLQAQKEVLVSQRGDLLNVIKQLQGQLDVLQAQVQFQQQEIIKQQEQFISQQEEIAGRNVQLALAQNSIPNQYGITPDAEVGWRIDQVLKKPDDMELRGQTLRFETGTSLATSTSAGWANGPVMVLYNVTPNPVIFEFEYTALTSAGVHSQPWITGPASVEVPPREGLNPGTSVVIFEATNISFQGPSDTNYDDSIKITTNLGGISWTIRAVYYRK